MGKKDKGRGCLKEIGFGFGFVFVLLIEWVRGDEE